MSKSLLRTDKEIAEIYERHRMTVYRVCFAYLKHPMDTEDAVQETFSDSSAAIRNLRRRSTKRRG